MFSSATVGWMFVSSVLIFLMVPGLALFYAGLTRQKNAVSLMMLCCLALAIGSVQWFVVGYSLAFSKSGGLIVGDFSRAFLMGVAGQPSALSAEVPELVFALYQGMFAAITPALAVGAAAERGRMLPAGLFISLWSLFVYYPVACWIWSPNGWGARLGVLDFAGGTLGHITTGVSAVLYSWKLGPRHLDDEVAGPQDVGSVILGTGLIWFGWFGFNGGSALAVNERTAVVCFNTNLAAAAGGLAWTVITYVRTRKTCPISFCNGVVAGLVAITPAAGYVDIAASPVIGGLCAVGCYMSMGLKTLLKCDDAMDILAIHGVGGVMGCLLTGVFARKAIAALDPTLQIAGGWLDGHWLQVAYQLADVAVAIVWTAVFTQLILVCLDWTPGLHLRVDKEREYCGLDSSELGLLSVSLSEK